MHENNSMFNVGEICPKRGKIHDFTFCHSFATFYSNPTHTIVCKNEISCHIRRRYICVEFINSGCRLGLCTRDFTSNIHLLCNFIFVLSPLLQSPMLTFSRCSQLFIHHWLNNLCMETSFTENLTDWNTNAKNVIVSCRRFNLCANSTRRKFTSLEGAQFKKCGKSLRQ